MHTALSEGKEQWQVHIALLTNQRGRRHSIRDGAGSSGYGSSGPGSSGPVAGPRLNTLDARHHEHHVDAAPLGAPVDIRGKEERVAQRLVATQLRKLPEQLGRRRVRLELGTHVHARCDGRAALLCQLLVLEGLEDGALEAEGRFEEQQLGEVADLDAARDDGARRVELPAEHIE